MKLNGFVLSALGLSVILLQADTLRMRDGRVITGTFISADSGDLRFRPDGQDVRHFNIYDVEDLAFTGGQSSNYNQGNPNAPNPARYNQPGYNQPGYNQPPAYNQNPAYAPPPGYSQRPGNVPYTRGEANQNGPDSSNYPYPNRPGNYVLPAGSVITVRMIDPVDSDAAHAGDTYHATLDQPVVANGQIIAPAGSDAIVQVVRIQQGGRLQGREEVALSLASFSANGQVYDLNTSNETVSSNSRGRQSAEVIGGGAALGAIIGAIAGGGEGAAIGAASGGAIGAGAQILRGQRVRVPAETRLSFTLTHDVRF